MFPYVFVHMNTVVFFFCDHVLKSWKLISIGMDGVDKQKVQKVIYEMSKGSKYFENERRKEALIRQKISNLRAQYVKLTDSEVSHFQMV